MSKRSSKLLLKDILTAIIQIEEYTKDINEEDLAQQFMVLHATLYNFQIIGEASIQLPEEVQKENSTIDWKKIKGFRNRLIHEYFGTDPKIVFEIIKKFLPILKLQIQNALDNNNYD